MDLRKGQILDIIGVFEQYHDCKKIDDIRNDINTGYKNDNDLVMVGTSEISNYWV